ncbi:MAG TPA: tRNA (adenosine(37)-N6)-dimethylallyltransferase MiaA [Deltaproteobacteria bacterium]|mgnify:CR=1 FL=1|nr:tRNA (adenosine(37)-N6)-dimethylallyltransferase MiaA [Deltaproteobacteria bacterium]
MEKISLVIINAPTATGKTALALELAAKYGGEIINADSMQVYRYLDIGTAKPTLEQRNLVRHHLIDVVNPDEEFNAALYADMAREVIAKLAREKKKIFIAGGTGLYIRALTKGIIETPPVDEKIRGYYKQLGQNRGKEYIYDLLKKKDEAAALKINPQDSVRVIRALEVLEQTGESITAKQARHSFADSPYNVLKIGLRIEREEIKHRIAHRTSNMLAMGLVHEVKNILNRGYKENIKSLQSLGYRQIINYLSGDYDLAEAERLINRDTWQYAKRQMTWFAADKTIQWFTPASDNAIGREIGKFWQEADAFRTR